MSRNYVKLETVKVCKTCAVQYSRTSVFTRTSYNYNIFRELSSFRLRATKADMFK